jgi:hypothetical protein
MPSAKMLIPQLYIWFPSCFGMCELEVLSRRLMITHYCQTADWLLPANRKIPEEERITNE